MKRASELGILNLDRREPSVASKFRMRKKVLQLLSFDTSHRILLGDARRMNPVKDESVHLVVTSPPYFDLVEYIDGSTQLGHIHDYEKFLRELDKVWGNASAN